MAAATMVLSTVLGNEIDWLAPTARNSNLLPVKANGEVRLRSPAWRGRCGNTGVPKPIAGALRLYEWAREHEIAIVFLSGRKEAQRAATERALKHAGFTQWSELLLRDPSESELKAAEFKAGRRAKLEEQGYAIVLNLGDQASDLAGGHAEQSLLMPNPFYQVL